MRSIGETKLLINAMLDSLSVRDIEIIYELVNRLYEVEENEKNNK